MTKLQLFCHLGIQMRKMSLMLLNLQLYNIISNAMNKFRTRNMSTIFFCFYDWSSGSSLSALICGTSGTSSGTWSTVSPAVSPLTISLLAISSLATSPLAVSPISVSLAFSSGISTAVTSVTSPAVSPFSIETKTCQKTETKN